MKCYLTVAEVRDLLGEPATEARTKFVRRWMEREGILLRVGRRRVVAADDFGEHFPHAAMRLTMRELEKCS